MDSDKDDPFQLDQIAVTSKTLGSSLQIMSDRQPDSPCARYIPPVNEITATARRDVGVAGPQAATIDTAGALGKVGTFKTPADSAQKPVASPVPPVKVASSPEADTVADAGVPSSRRMGS